MPRNYWIAKAATTNIVECALHPPRPLSESPDNDTRIRVEQSKKHTPMKSYHFTLQYGEFEATLVMTGEWSLYEFAEYLLQTMSFDLDHSFQFCDNLKNPYRSKEKYTLFADMGEGDGEPGVRETMISEVFKAKKRMVLHFDYGDDWFFVVTCTGVTESDSERKSRKVVSTSGKPPVQYPGYEE